MNRIIGSFLLLMILALSCTTEKVAKLTPAQQQAKLDSFVAAQQQLIKLQEEEYRRDRLSIEVKEKADSILAIARRNLDSLARNTTLPIQDTITTLPIDTAQSPVLRIPEPVMEIDTFKS